MVCENNLDTWEQREEVTKGGQGRRGGWKSVGNSSIWLRPRNILKEIWRRRPWLSEQYRSERDVSLSWSCGRLFWCMPMQYCFQPFLRYLGFVSPTAQEVENTSKTDVSQCFHKNVVTGCNYCCIKYVVRWVATHPLSFLYCSEFTLPSNWQNMTVWINVYCYVLLCLSLWCLCIDSTGSWSSRWSLGTTAVYHWCM